jgi:hypothetical protein
MQKVDWNKAERVTTGSAMERAFAAIDQGKALARRRAIRANAHAFYNRARLSQFINVPAEWLQPYNERCPYVGDAIIRKLKAAIERDRRNLRGPFHRPLAAPLDRETALWGLLGGEMLRRGGNVKRPEEIR